MKTKLITLSIAILMQFISPAQSLHAIWPVFLCPGDTLTFRFQYSKGDQNKFVLQAPNEGYWYTTPIPHTASDTIITMKIKTPPSFPLGYAIFYPSPNIGDALSMEFGCITTGIITQQAEHPVPLYYDLLGNQCTPTLNTILIEHIDNVYRKVIIQN